MLPRELIEELVGGCGATRLHILVALADGIDSFLIILALPLEVVGQRVVERISRTLPSSARKVLQLCQSLRLERNRVHFLKVEVRHVELRANSAAAGYPDGGAGPREGGMGSSGKSIRQDSRVFSSA